MKKVFQSIVVLCCLLFVSACKSDPPVLELEGENSVTIEFGNSYEELGVTYEGTDYDLVIEGTVDENSVGTYVISYSLVNSDGTTIGPVERTVHIEDSVNPVVTLVGEDEMTVEAGTTFIDPGVNVTDNYDSALEAIVEGTIDTSILGEQTIRYTALDSSSNESSVVERTVTVVDTTAPVVELYGDNITYVEVNSTFDDPGVNIEDNYDDNIYPEIINTVDESTVGVYTVTYMVTDSEGNQAVNLVRTVIVQDTTAPTISLLGENEIVIPIGFNYDDLGVEVFDNYSENEDIIITVDTNLDTLIEGVYEISFQAMDEFDNTSEIITREITVKDFSSDFEWNLLEDDTYEVVRYIGNDKVVYIPGKYNGLPVTVIGARAMESSMIEFVYIPNTVLVIENYAFFDSDLMNVVFEEDASLIKLERWAFNRTNLVEIILPESLEIMGEDLFAYTNIEKILIPMNVDTFIGNPFSSMRNLSTLEVSSENSYFTAVDNVLFTIDMTKLIAYGKGNILDSYTVPNGVEIIGVRAFSEMYYLKAIALPEGLKILENGALFGTGIIELNIPSTVESINHNAVSMTYNLTEFTVHPENQYFSTIDGVLFNKEATTLIVYPGGNEKITYRIPKGTLEVKSNAFWGSIVEELILSRTVTTLRSGAFIGMDRIERIIIPSSVINIESSMVDTVKNPTIYIEFTEQPETWDDSWNFQNYDVVWGYDVNLYLDYSYKLIVDPITMQNTYEIIDYYGSETELLLASEISGLPVTSVGEGAFQDTNIVSVHIPSTINIIKDNAFSFVESLQVVTFDEESELIEIGTYAFMLTGIEEISLPISLETINRGAFQATKITSIYIPRNVNNLILNQFDTQALEEYVVDEENSFYASVQGVLYNKDKTKLIEYPKKKNDISFIIPETVQVIGSLSMINNDFLESITFSSNVTTIEHHAIYGLNVLTQMTIPETVLYIGESNFMGLNYITSIEVEEGNPNYISDDGVLYTKDMETLIAYPSGKTGTTYTILSTVQIVGEGAFGGAKNIEIIYVPSSVTTIEHGSFMIRNLKEIYIPNSVMNIDHGAFNSNSDLIIYIEYDSKPDGWPEDWNAGNQVVWGAEMPNQE